MESSQSILLGQEKEGLTSIRGGLHLCKQSLKGFYSLRHSFDRLDHIGWRVEEGEGRGGREGLGRKEERGGKVEG